MEAVNPATPVVRTRIAVSHGVSLLGFTLFYAVVYRAALAGGYLHADDYAWLPLGSERERQAALNFCIRQGRPLGAAVAYLLAKLADSRGIDCARLAILFLLGAFSWLTSQCLKKMMAPWPAFALAFAIGTLPAFTNVIGWISMGTHLTAALLALVGAALIFPTRGKTRTGLGAFAFFSALAIHQSAAQMFWLLPFSLALFDWGTFRRRFPIFIGVGASVTALYLFSFWVAVRVGLLAAAPRTELTTACWAKIKWFVREPLRNALNLWQLPPNPYVALAVGGLILVGLFSQKEWKTAARLLTVSTAFFTLAYLPNLVVQESWASYRTLLVLSPFALLLVFHSLTLVFDRSAWVTTAFAIIGGLWASQNTEQYLVLQRRAEIRFVQARINTVPRIPGTVPLYLIRGTKGWQMPGAIYDEFNMPSSTQKTALTGMVRFALAEMGVDPLKAKICVGGVKCVPEGATPVEINMREFRWP